MAFQTFTCESTPVPASAAAIPRPPSAPRNKRGRGGSSPDCGRRRVRKSSSSGAPSVPLKGADVAWTDAENAALKEAVMEYGERKRDWPKVGRAMAVHGRDKDACRTQWFKLRPPVKGSWTEEEDRLLALVVSRQGPSGWSSIAKHISGRNAKQCRERWVNHLNPNVNKTQWTDEEDKRLVAAHDELGNKWSEIAKRLPGRPDNAVKNRWYTLKNRANGGGRKRRRSRRPTPNLATLLAKHAQVDLTTVDETTKRTFSTLATRLSQLATEQLRKGALPAARGATAGATAAAAPASTTTSPATVATSPTATATSPSSPASTSSTDDGILCARPPAKRPRQSFRRRALLHAAPAGIKVAATMEATSCIGSGDEEEEDALEMSQVSMASDVIRDAAVNLSIDLERSIGLDSASFASDLLTALDASLDELSLSAIVAQAAAIGASTKDAAIPPSPTAGVPTVTVPTSPVEARAAATPSPPTCPAPPTTRPRHFGRRPGRTLTTVVSSELLAPSPSVKPAPLVAAVEVPEGLLNAVPIPPLEASPLDDLSMRSLSLSLADLSFFQADNEPTAATTASSIDLLPSVAL